MAIRLTCDVNNTKELLAAILTELNADNRVMFLCEPGCGGPTIQRARVALSRIRNSIKNRGRKRKHFQMHHSIHRHTEGGKRFDAVVVWKTKTLRNAMSETLEDLVGHGDSL